MAIDVHREPWNKGIIVGQKAPIKLKEVWAIRMRPAIGSSRTGTRVVYRPVAAMPHVSPITYFRDRFSRAEA